MCLISALVGTGMSVGAAWMSVISAATALVGTAASTAMGVTSSIQQGKAAEAQANYQAQVDRRNARIAQQNAEDKRQEGIEEARMTRLKTAQKVGLQQASLAANGVDVSEGTALDMIEDTSAMGELDALTTRYNYEKHALAFEEQANNFNNQANLDVFAGQNAYRSGMMNAVGTGLNGLGQAAGVSAKWYGENSLGKNTTNIKTKNRVSGGILGDNITFA